MKKEENYDLIVTSFKVNKKVWHDFGVLAALEDMNRGAIIRKMIGMYLQGKVNIDDDER